MAYSRGSSTVRVVWRVFASKTWRWLPLMRRSADWFEKMISFTFSFSPSAFFCTKETANKIEKKRKEKVTNIYMEDIRRCLNHGKKKLSRKQSSQSQKKGLGYRPVWGSSTNSWFADDAQSCLFVSQYRIQASLSRTSADENRKPKIKFKFVRKTKQIFWAEQFGLKKEL